MASYGELFPGRKLKHEGDGGSPGREHDPGGPLDLERGVVFLSPPEQQAAPEQQTPDQPTPPNQPTGSETDSQDTERQD